jgi:hypothetical protein
LVYTTEDSFQCDLSGDYFDVLDTACIETLERVDEAAWQHCGACHVLEPKPLDGVLAGEELPEATLTLLQKCNSFPAVTLALRLYSSFFSA